MRDEMYAREHRGQQGVRALVARLRIDYFRGAQRAAAATRHIEPPRELRSGEDHLRRLGGTEGRRAGAHRHRAHERTHDHRCARANELCERHASERLGEDLGHAARGRHRTHRTREHGGHDDRPLVVAGELAQRAEHAAIEGERRVGVDVAEQHGMRVDEVRAEEHFGHAHGIRGVPRGLGRAFAGLVAVPEIGVLHIEMPFAGGDVHRLAGAAAREMDRGRHVCELDEVHEVLERGIAPTALEICDERRSAHRREHHRITAEAYGARRVARMHLEGRGCRLEQGTAETARYPHPLALHICARRAPQTQ